jgi:hypothetical protein
MPSYIRPLREGRFPLRALMQSALPLLNNAVASQAGSRGRVWGSRSDLSRHQHGHPSQRTAGYFHLLMSPARCHPSWRSSSKLCPVQILASVASLQRLSSLSRASMAPAHRFRAHCRQRPHPDAAAPTPSGHACSLPRPPSDATRDAQAPRSSIGCDRPFAAAPSAGSPVLRGSEACARSSRLAC